MPPATPGAVSPVLSLCSQLEAGVAGLYGRGGRPLRSRVPAMTGAPGFRCRSRCVRAYSPRDRHPPSRRPSPPRVCARAVPSIRHRHTPRPDSPPPQDCVGRGDLAVVSASDPGPAGAALVRDRSHSSAGPHAKRGRLWPPQRPSPPPHTALGRMPRRGGEQLAWLNPPEAAASHPGPKDRPEPSWAPRRHGGRTGPSALDRSWRPRYTGRADDDRRPRAGAHLRRARRVRRHRVSPPRPRRACATSPRSTAGARALPSPRPAGRTAKDGRFILVVTDHIPPRRRTLRPRAHTHSRARPVPKAAPTPRRARRPPPLHRDPCLPELRRHPARQRRPPRPPAGSPHRPGETLSWPEIHRIAVTAGTRGSRTAHPEMSRHT